MMEWCVSDPLPAVKRPALPLFKGESKATALRPSRRRHVLEGNLQDGIYVMAPGSVAISLTTTLPLKEGESRRRSRRQGVAHKP
jgi:hypothetical protein